jgi:predicted GH43/DUF377 family glycosyl hydrolase
MGDFKIKRHGIIMEPEPGNPMEAEGVLNPASVRGPDGELYLFPRLVAKGNYSRIGIARVRFNKSGKPESVERLGIALEPETDYEMRPDGGGGCEDPRIIYVEPLKQYIMTYTAFSPVGPRIAIARSKDLFKWERLGLAVFEPYQGIEFTNVDNKDASFFSLLMPNPGMIPELAILHRPLFPGTRPEETKHHPKTRELDLDRESIWISYCSILQNDHKPIRHGKFTSHQRLASPVAKWERLKIGGGTPPIMTRHGWMIVYHGVHKLPNPVDGKHDLCYSAGVMILSKEHPTVIRYRSWEPLIKPIKNKEYQGLIPNVVFPTGIDRRDDLGLPDRFDVYYGINDSRIGVASFKMPEVLRHEGIADPPEAKV